MIKTICLISNFLNHHQLPFCESMKAKLGDGFKFIATESIPFEQLAMGYEDMNTKYSFVERSYENDDCYSYAMQLVYDSDLVIMGAAPEKLIQRRLNENKITFRYSERVFRKGIWRIFDPRVIKSLYIDHFRFRQKNLFMLCAGAYTAGDFSLIHCYKNKMFKWGYFPKVLEYDIEKILTRKKNNKKIKILWVGRLLTLKHPEKAIYVAERLKGELIDFELQIIGEGEQEKTIRELIIKRNLSDHIKILRFMPPRNVREYMEQANIFLFTSDYQEGWGAVLNEAMNSGCAVVASHAIGSVPFLIDHGKNGLVYKSNDFEDLYRKVKLVISDETLKYELGLNAYLTLSQTWNAEIASENLMYLFFTIKSGKENEIKNGPGSTAQPIKQSKMYDYCIK